MGGLTKKIEGLKGQFQELVWGNGGLNILLKGLVDLGTGILKVINDLGGLSTVVTVAIGLLVTFKGALAIDALLKFASGLSLTSGALGTLIMALPNAITAWKAFGAGIITTNTAIQASIPLLGLALTAITLLTLGIAKHNKELEQKRQQTIETTQAEISSLDSLLEKVKDETLTRESLYELIKDTDAYSKEIEDMEDVNEMRQSVIDKINEEKLARAQELIDVGQTGFEQATQRQESSTSDFKFTPYSDTRFNEPYSDISSATGTQQQIDALQKYKDTLVSVRAETEKGSFNWNQYTKEISNVEAELSSLQSTQKEDILTIEKYNNALGLTGQKYDESTGQIVKMTDAEKIAFNAKQELNKETKEEIDGLSESVQALEDTKTALEEYNDALSDLSSMDDAFTTLNDAISEYNSSGEFTLDTLDKLLSLGDEYLALLEFENGQVSLNKDGAIALANAKIDEAEASAIQSAKADIASMSENDLADAMANTSTQASASVSGLSSAQQAIRNLGLEADTSSLKMQNLYHSLGGKGNLVVGSNAEERTKALANEIKALESLRGNLGKVTTATTTNTKATGGNTSAKKSNTDATKAQTDALKKQKEALEDEIDQYERAISYIIDLLDEEIDKLEERRDTEIDTTQAEIDKIKEKQDVIETSVNEQISLYEKQKKAREDFWDSEIDKIKESSDALDDRIERQKLLDNITSAKKKKVLVYTENGFEYQQDQEALTKAKQELANYDAKKNKEKQIKTLEEKKEAESKIYDDEIDDLNDYLAKLKKTNDDEIAELNAHIKKVESKYNKKINYLKDYKKRFEDQTKAYKKAQDKLLAEQLTGIDFENSNWKTRIGNLNTFVKNYNEKLASVTEVTNKLNQLAKEAEAAAKRINDAISGAGGGSGGSTDSGTSSYTVFQIIKEYSTSGEASSKISSDNADGYTSYGGKYVTYKKKGTYSTETEASSQANSLNTSAQGKSRYGFKALATGSSYVDNDGMFLVGDNPSNNELVIGSKLNGSLMNLSKGSGVVNAKSTNTLAGILNNLSSMGNGHTSNLALNAQGMNLYIDNLNLPQVSDGIGFVEYIKSNAKSLAIQYGSKR